MFRFKREGRWQEVSSAEFGERVRRASQGLVSLGVQPGDRVAILSENRLEWAIADMAVLGAAAVDVPIYPTLLPEQIAYILRDSGPRVAFCSTREQAEKLLSVRERVPSLEHIVTFDPVDRAGLLPLPKLEQLGQVRIGEHPQDYDERAGRVVRDDLATIIYTSGTTGDPKGVMLTHDNLVQNVLNIGHVVEIGPSDSCLSFLPLSHVFERTVGYYFMVHRGVQINYAESIEAVPQNMLEVRPTVVVSVPRLYEKIYARVMSMAAAGSPAKRRIFAWAKEVGREVVARKLSGKPLGLGLRMQHKLADALVFAKLRARTGGRIRFFASGGAPLSKEIAEFFYSAGLTILEGYGLTETSPVISVNTPERLRFGSVGPPIPNVEVRIAEDGEILTRSRSVMKGYYNKPEATAEVLVDGWFHTGDIGRLDEDGFLYITDRKKDIIVTAGGKNIAPQPTENRLKLNKYIAEAALIGDRRKYVVALIVPDFEELEKLAAELGLETGDRRRLLDDPRIREAFQRAIDEVNVHLPRYEQIKKFALLDRPFSIESGELTPTLKVKRRVIEEKFRDVIDSLYGG
ncbi:MAG: long-chain fatty acid--CoA ligase [Acidobacteria bacterium]|nr:MAG: long-chain fatty acid--CoA ligase [Acidobacteriota bacterium]